MHPFTLVLCQAPGCRGHDATPRGPVEQALGETTRHCPHGVLVLTGCLMGTLCRACGPATGTPTGAGDPGGPGGTGGRVAVVQPCGDDRAPSGPAVLVGPIRDRADTDALDGWLREGTLTADRLPERLRGYERVLRRGALN